MNSSPIEKLVKLGFSEYEARAWITLLTESPTTGHRLAERSGIPPSTVCGVVKNLAHRGAVVTLPQDDAVTYAAVPAAEFLEQLGREHERIITSLKDELSLHKPTLDPGLVWTITGHSNIMARARFMIDQATARIYLALFPADCGLLQPELEAATNRDVQVVVYTTDHIDLPGGRVVVTPVPSDAMDSRQIVELILVRDGQEALIGERLGMQPAQASWTRSPVLVNIAEHHLVRGGRRRFLVS